MSDTRRLDGLIAELGADLEPIKPLKPPAWRAAAWLGAVVLMGSGMAAFADVRDMAHRLMGAPDMWLAVLGSSLTALLGAVATFELSLPDRRPAWALLPLPGLALWVAASGMGCLRAWFIPDTVATPMAETVHCFRFIVGFSIPLSVLMALMVRRACPLRPGLTATVAGLAVAAGAATLLTFFHPYDATATDLCVHMAAVVVVVGLNHLLSSRLWAQARARFHPARRT